MNNILFPELKNYFQRRFFRFIDRRVASANEHKLDGRKLYIFPTVRGFVFIGLILVLWLLGTNYQNNLVLSLSFFLISIFIVAILQTHANLHGLKLKLVGVEPAFAGESADFVFSLSSSAPLERIELRWQFSEFAPRVANTKRGKAVSTSVPLHVKNRGWSRPGRLLIQSYYPLGLMRCWSWLNWDASALVYPAPHEGAEPRSSAIEGEVTGEHSVKGGEDFSGLAEYRPGDSLRHVAWKSFARERGLHIKEFSQTMSEEIWLDINTVQGGDIEERLSILCFWALQYYQQDKYFGLKLPGKIISPDKGENHKRLVLEALALFDK